MRGIGSVSESRTRVIGGILIVCVPWFLMIASALARTPDAQFDTYELGLWGDPGTEACANVGVTNVGDEFLDDICFFSSGGGGVIPLDAIGFVPPCMSLAPGETEILTICVSIPPLTPAGHYVATVYLQAAGGTVYDGLPLGIVVGCLPGLDILDDACDLSGNEMALTLALGDSGEGHFEIANVGNCALTDIEGPPPTGPPLVVIPQIPTFCDWGETVEASVKIRLVEPGLSPGPYEMMFTVTADGGAADYFWLTVQVVTAVESASWSRIKACFRSQ